MPECTEPLAPPSPLNRVVIVGGGTAGWMTACALATGLRGRYQIELVESDEIGIVGVGEATIPMIQLFNRIVGLDEQAFMRATQATFKLGIEFVDWGRVGDRYMHGFGRIGQDLWTVRFDQYWQLLRMLGKVDDLAPYSISRSAARAGRFLPGDPSVGNSPLNDIRYAYHFDAGLFARHLADVAIQRGVRRTEGRILRVHQRPENGHVAAVELEGGRQVEGDFFIDCTGFRGLLIEQTLRTGYESWTHWLPCDRALAVPCGNAPSLLPYTRSTARPAGWQWRIPLQHRIGNGHVYCSGAMSDDQAHALLMGNLDGPELAEPRQIKFVTGIRRQAWNRNVVAVGLSSGFLEPLESTSIHMIQSAIQRIIDFFPDQGFSRADINEYNRQTRFEAERIRDFIILHYHLNQRDEPFWRELASMDIPDTLAHKIDLYRSRGRLLRVDSELFTEDAWLQVFTGQNLFPAAVHPLVGVHDLGQVEEYLEGVRQVIANCVQVMPSHEDFIARHCAAPRA